MSGSGRRRWVLGAAGALAAAGGAGWSWWRSPPDPAAAPSTTALWEQRFERPQGGDLVMAEHRGRALLLNFWATWCPPCIKELPELDRFAQAHAERLQVIGLAIDKLEAVQAFLAKHPVGFAVGLAGLTGTDLARSLGNPAGVLPFTVLLNAQGKVVRRKLGETQHAELVDWLKLL